MADYLERERDRDATTEQGALFLTAASIAVRTPDGRLSLRAFNLILEQIGRWHDAEQRDPTRHVSPLRPHDLRHTFAFQLAKVTGADAYELERRLGSAEGGRSLKPEYHAEVTETETEQQRLQEGSL